MTYKYVGNPTSVLYHLHKLKFLEPRVDFFKRHPSQFAQGDE